VVTQERSGIPRSLNRGVALARGTYIARQDADDISLPTRLAKQVDFLDRHPDVALVGTFVRGIDGHGNTMGDLVLPVDHDTIRQVLFQSYAFISPTFLIRRDALLTVGGYRTEFPVAEDTDLELRISERFRVANLPEMLYLYRRSPQSVTIHRSNLRQIYIEIARELARQRMVEGADILTPGGAVEQPPVQVAGDR
jgi:GT2 family glycosyltransferase